MRHVPNLLSAFRLAAVPVLLGLAWNGAAAAFLWGFAIALLTDIADGFIARRWNLTSEFGAKLDSYGDLATYAAAPFCAWWLYPEIILGQLSFVVIALSCYVAPILLGLMRYGKLTSYHTWIAKLTAIVMGPAVVLMLGFNAPGLFHVAVLLLVVGAIEETAITAMLKRWHANVPSLLHATRIAEREELRT